MNKKMLSKNNLELALISRAMDLKDIKCEVVLIMCKDLVQKYLKSNDEGKLVNLREDGKENTLTNNIILNEMKRLEELFKDSVLSADNLQIIMSTQHSSSTNKIKARLVEPTAFFYNILSRSFIAKMKELQKNEEKLSWIPDQLAVFLILDMIEKGYTFKKFSFIQKYDFSTILSIYTKNNIELKKELGVSLFSPKEKQTIITKMQMLSSHIIEKLVSSKYKK